MEKLYFSKSFFFERNLIGHGELLPKAIFFLNLENIFDLDKTYGHNVVDELFFQLYKKLRNIQGLNVEVSYRQIHFLISSHSVTDGDFWFFVNSIKNIMKCGFNIKNNFIFPSFSFSAALFKKNFADQDVFLILMHLLEKSKKTGRPEVSVFLNSFKSQCLSDFKSSFFLYQPQVDPVSSKINGLEIVFDNDFIEKVYSGFSDYSFLIDQIYDYLKVSLLNVLFLNADGNYKGVICFKVSGLRMSNFNFIKKLCSTLRQVPFPIDRIEIKVDLSGVESGAISRVISSVEYLKRLGIGVGIDSLGFFAHYPMLFKKDSFVFDFVFFSRENIAAIKQNEKMFLLIKNITCLLKDLNLEYCAEGIDDLQHFNILRNIGFRSIQGDFCGLPLSAADVKRLIDKDFFDRVPDFCNHQTYWA